MAALALLTAATDLHALPGDGFQVFAAATLTHDDNILRQPDDGGASAARGDTVRTLNYGFELDVLVGLQRIEAGVARSEARHARFGVLDHDGHRARALWHWQLGQRSRGRLGASHTRSLAALGSLLGGVPGASPNVLRTRRSFLDASHDLTARWQLRLERDHLDQDNSAAERRANDIVADRTALTLSYTTPPGNRAGLSWRARDARLPQPLGVGGTPVDNSYEQRGAGVFVEWSPSAPTLLKLHLGHEQRRHAQLPQRDFEHTEALLGIGWRPSVLTTFDLVARREISADEEFQIGAVRVRGVALQAQWLPSEMLRLQAHLEQARRDQLGDPETALGFAPLRGERVRSVALLLSVQPLPTVTLEAQWRREQRRGTQAERARQRFDSTSLTLRFAL